MSAAPAGAGGRRRQRRRLLTHQAKTLPDASLPAGCCAARDHARRNGHACRRRSGELGQRGCVPHLGWLCLHSILRPKAVQLRLPTHLPAGHDGSGRRGAHRCDARLWRRRGLPLHQHPHHRHHAQQQQAALSSPSRAPTSSGTRRLCRAAAVGTGATEPLT